MHTQTRLPRPTTITKPMMMPTTNTITAIAKTDGKNASDTMYTDVYDIMVIFDILYKQPFCADTIIFMTNLIIYGKCIHS